MIAKANLAKLTSALDQQVYQVIVHESVQQKRSVSVQDVQAALPDRRLRITDLSHVLASLEQRGYIASQTVGGRRLYSMREMSGAGAAPPWAADGSFNRQLAALWMDTAYELVARDFADTSDYVSLERIGMGLRTKFPAATSDITQTVLTALQLEGRLVAAPHGGSTVYAPAPGHEAERRRGDAFQVVPCTCCPLLGSCGAGSPINAVTCEYMQIWVGAERGLDRGVDLEDYAAAGMTGTAGTVGVPGMGSVDLRGIMGR